MVTISAEIVILTALPVEYNAVRAHLTDLVEYVHPKGTIYECGVLGTSPRLTCAVCEIGAHNVTAARETERAIEFFQPRVAVFVGVAGGLKDVNVGDVVAATKIYGYESGKANDEFSPRPEVRAVSYPLEQRCKAQARAGAWRERIIEGFGEPNAFVAPIAAGASVVASTKSELFKFIRRNYGDALAVEMEGHGFADAVRACHPVLCLLVRGISDLVDGKSEADEGGSQPRASRNAAAFAFDVLEAYWRGMNDNQVEPSSSRPEASVASSGNLLLLGSHFFRASSMKNQGETVNLTLGETTPESEAALRGMNSRRSLPFAYGNLGGDVIIESATSVADSSGTLTGQLELRFANREGAHSLEAGFRQNDRSYSIDDIAQMRAEWILLGREPAAEGFGFLRAMVAGDSTSGGVKVGHVLQWLQDKRHDDFLLQARLLSVYTLLATRTVERILELSLRSLGEDRIEVTFNGVRARVYNNVEPLQLSVSGICSIEN